MSDRIRIGEILVRAGVIDPDQLSAALGEQRRWGKPLGATLVKMGFAEERDLVRGLASQLSLPVASLEGKRIAGRILDLVPADMAQENLVLPLFVKQDDRRTTLFLAMEDPGDLAVLDDLAFRTGMQVKPVMMAPSELCEGIDRYYRDRATPSLPPQPAEPAAATSPNGTEELVRHFTLDAEAELEEPAEPLVLDEEEPFADDAASTQPDLEPELPAELAGESSIDPLALETSEVSNPESVLDEVHLKAPPPREENEADIAAGCETASLPPIESLASYDAKTRTILHVLTQLLIENGVVSREEFHARVSALADVEAGKREETR